jgi:hypothetical protein
MKIRNMMRTPLAIASILAALSLGIASAKSYNFILSAPSMAGSHELKADQRYSLEVKGSEAVIRGERDRQAVNVPVKAEEGATKYDATTVDSMDGASPAAPKIITALKLGGTKTKLVFAQ